VPESRIVTPALTRALPRGRPDWPAERAGLSTGLKVAGSGAILLFVV